MKTEAVIRFTKDGKEIIIREATEEDAAELIELKKSYIKNTMSIPLYEFEYKNDIHMEKEWINRFTNESNSLLLVAEHENKLIGNIDLNGNQRKKLFHTGMIGMGIAYQWQNKKIGSFLMDSLINWATSKSQLRIIWLEVYSTNIGGIKLYEKFGFEQCGLIKNFFEKENPADKITMVKHL
ncbi:GNAT family N-acetyltransferase [Flavobacterium sp. AG291]|uniref:GNAT family N-acetyltransferase n=1 Tax=Flavobacterium sp. AG291 TaxID=2184000 RepID=UPI000E0B183C|nr:GNAT family N-acetyltransferase [Flavobacterium sp. AG291]RDI14395.1 RimJ/RimL family protein N-acetyltransferase [Flavobacterium sp. AG291]